MKILLSTICETAFHTAETGNLNIMGIFEGISAKQFPATHAKMAFLSIVSGNPNEEFKFSFEIISPSGELILGNKNNPNTARIGPNGKHHITQNVVAVKLPEHGKYSVNLYLGNEKETLYFEVVSTN